MNRVVLDTNVVVSGFLNAENPPGRLLNAVVNGLLLPVLDSRIFAEYREVLLRPRFGLDREDVESVLDLIRFEADWISPAPFLGVLPDEGDRPFVEAALSAGVPLVTDNLRHFQPVEGLCLMQPADALFLLRSGS